DRFATAALFAEALAVPAAGPARVRPSRRGRRSPVRQLAYLGIVALGLLAAVGVFARFHARSGRNRAAARRMLVVLPVANLGRPEDEYFADGMTEELTARLAGLQGRC